MSLQKSKFDINIPLVPTSTYAIAQSATGEIEKTAKLLTLRTLNFGSSTAVNDTRIDTDIHAQQAPNAVNSKIFPAAFVYNYTNTNNFPVVLDLTIRPTLTSNSSGGGGVTNPFAANDKTVIYWSYNSSAVDPSVIIESGILASSGLVGSNHTFYAEFQGAGAQALTHDERTDCNLYRIIAPGGSISITPNFWLISTFLNGASTGATLRTWRTIMTFIEKISNL